MLRNGQICLLRTAAFISGRSLVCVLKCEDEDVEAADPEQGEHKPTYAERDPEEGP